MLQEFNAKNAQFRILPQYKVKSEGEVVSVIHSHLMFGNVCNWRKAYLEYMVSIYVFKLKAGKITKKG